MGCVPNDDLCHLQLDYSAYIRQIERDEQIDRSLFVLGVFNGRAYTYYEADGKTFIMVVNSTNDLKPKTSKIGKFHLPDAASPDFMESNGVTESKGDSNHG